MKAITTGMYTLPAFVSREAKDLVQRMLTVDSKDRITVAQIQRHAWLSQVQQAAQPQRLQKMPSLVCWGFGTPHANQTKSNLSPPGHRTRRRTRRRPSL
jgi:serine/threonine protein kinase